MNAWYARGRTGEQVLDAVEMMIDAETETDFEWGVLRLERLGLTDEEIRQVMFDMEIV